MVQTIPLSRIFAVIFSLMSRENDCIKIIAIREKNRRIVIEFKIPDIFKKPKDLDSELNLQKSEKK